MLFDFTHKTPVDFIDEIGWCFTGIFLPFFCENNQKIALFVL